MRRCKGDAEDLEITFDGVLNACSMGLSLLFCHCTCRVSVFAGNDATSNFVPRLPTHKPAWLGLGRSKKTKFMS